MFDFNDLVEFAGSKGQAAEVDTGVLIVFIQSSYMDFTAADRQFWRCCGTAKQWPRIADLLWPRNLRKVEAPRSAPLHRDMMLGDR